MEKIKFMFDDTNEEVEFFVLEQTKVNGNSYILVTDSEEDEAELMGVLKVFEELLEDVDIDM